MKGSHDLAPFHRTAPDRQAEKLVSRVLQLLRCCGAVGGALSVVVLLREIWEHARFGSQGRSLIFQTTQK